MTTTCRPRAPGRPVAAVNSQLTARSDGGGEWPELARSRRPRRSPVPIAAGRWSRDAIARPGKPSSDARGSRRAAERGRWIAPSGPQGTERPAPHTGRHKRAPRPARARIRLSSGHREPRDAGDYAELIVARLVGRSLTPVQGLLAQVAGVILLAGAFYWFLASGAMAQVVTPSD